MRYLSKIAPVLLLCCTYSLHTPATTYYVDYKAGSDSNSGLSTSAPWKTAPGMRGSSVSTALNPGDIVIFRGCVVWPSSVFNWNVKYGGTGSTSAPYNAISAIYYGGSPSTNWFDSTACSTWNRPIFDAGGASAPFQAATGDPRMILPVNWTTYDNIEFRNYYADGGGSGNTSGISGGYANYFQGGYGIVFSNSYFHAVIEKYFSIGTGNVAANSSTITNFVPFSYSPSPSSSWTSGLPKSDNITVAVYGYTGGGAQITVNSISSSSPYTITTTMATQSAACSGCIVVLGHGDDLSVFSGNGGQCYGCSAIGNIIDALDSTVNQYNPWPDCGATEGNNNFCGTGVSAAWRQPGIWRGNILRYVCNGIVGDFTEWSGNTLEYLRPCANPTAHTNAVEATESDPVNSTALFYNNVLRHTTVLNTSTPTGHWTIGILVCIDVPSGSNLYVFNNVAFDTLQNYVWERCSPNTGTTYFFNNSGDGGPAWNLSYGISNGINTGDEEFNDYGVTSSAAPFAAGSGQSLSPAPFSNLIESTNPGTMNGPGATYAYSPNSATSPTVGAGSTTLSTICGQLASVSTAAQNACQQDTTYGVTYNSATHQITATGRTPLTRPSPPSIGAYEWSASSGGGGGSPPSIPGGVSATATGPNITVSWSASSGSPTGYYLYRSTVSGSSYTQIANVTSGVTYTDTNLQYGTYYYVVQSYNTTGNSANSTQVSAASTTGFVQQCHNGPLQSPATSVSCTMSAQTIPGDTMLCSAGWNATSGSPSSFADSAGNSYSVVLGPTVASGNASQLIYLASNIAQTTSNVITATWGSSQSFPEIMCSEYNGKYTTDSTGSGSATSGTAISASLVTTNATDFLVGFTFIATTTSSIGSGFTQRILTTGSDVSADNYVTSTGTYSFQATQNSSGWWIANFVALKPGTGTPALSLSPSPVAFGNQEEGTTSSAIAVTVTNTGTANETLSTPYFTITGTNSGDFSVSSSTCSNGGTITVGGSCVPQLKFSPSTTSAESASLNINGTASSSVSLTGTGTPQPPCSVPVILPVTGGYPNPVAVTITDSSGCNIFYTTNGTTPTCSSTSYSGQFNVVAPVTVSAIACESSFSNSSTTSVVYTITNPRAAPPSFVQTATPGQITMTSITSTAVICYSTSGPPQGNNNGGCNIGTSVANGTTVNVGTNVTLQAIASSVGFSDSSLSILVVLPPSPPPGPSSITIMLYHP